MAASAPSSSARRRAAALALLLAAGCRTPQPDVPMVEFRQPSRYRFINPLLECDELASRHELRPFRSEVEKEIARILASKRATHVSVYFRDLNNGPWFGIDESERFLPGSLLKVPLLISYLLLAQTRKDVLDEKISYQLPKEETFRQRFPPADPIKPGVPYRVEEMLERMIVQSDNRTSDALLAHLDIRWLSRIYEDMGLTLAVGKEGLTVKQYASFFRILYNGTYLNRDMSEKALNWLSQAHFRDGLVAGVPASVPVAHKFGERSAGKLTQLHDCGIVYWPGHPYLLAVMTRGEDTVELARVIADISRIVAKEMERQLGRPERQLQR